MKYLIILILVCLIVGCSTDNTNSNDNSSSDNDTSVSEESYSGTATDTVYGIGTYISTANYGANNTYIGDWSMVFDSVTISGTLIGYFNSTKTYPDLLVSQDPGCTIDATGQWVDTGVEIRIIGDYSTRLACTTVYEGIYDISYTY